MARGSGGAQSAIQTGSQGAGSSTNCRSLTSRIWPRPCSRPGPRHAVIVDLEDVALVGVDFGAEAAGFTGIPAEITSQVPSGVGDVLGELGDEVSLLSQALQKPLGGLFILYKQDTSLDLSRFSCEDCRIRVHGEQQRWRTGLHSGINGLLHGLMIWSPELFLCVAAARLGRPAG